ncbi:MAG: GDP-mannose 4,6-dehydratase [Candidatus Nanoarchaeia archaeon]|nr:GDP-mannose 4,6-dehydratase [Candidatus Nanoarchaeia archaeon]MDD5358114.1 GDP-mannose 4,6-dehydratase [Candidatus Nanoarchaeia archaeon]MDD5589301.1 GDP-mannose 4,6-dehydratase [Candidatus Nanoarchaeia archaeon]
MNKEFWENKNVLVTGAGGFKGSHLLEKLGETEANIISLVRDFDPKSYFEMQKLGKKSTVVVGDLKDYRKISDILSKYEITTIFHLGAQPIVTTALSNPVETLETNIMGTVNILDSARINSKIEEIVMISSDKAYGPTDKIPYKETERLQGKAPYDVSKSCADLIAQMYSKIFDLPVTIARSVNVFGPGDLNWNRIIPGIMESIIKNKPLKIRSDGKMIREYIYVKDSIDAYINLAENIKKTRGEAFNISGKNIMSVLEIIEKTSEALGRKVNYEIINNAKAEIPKQYLDGNKIKTTLGWEAKTNFEEAIKETFEWYTKLM